MKHTDKPMFSKYICCSLLVTIASLFSLVAHAQVSAEERQALIDFYNSTNGDNWTNSQNGLQPWLINDPNSPVTDWFGITVSRGEVNRISLSRNNLTGSLPESLGDLQGLQFLSLASNQIAGELPASITSLTKLLNISISNNQIGGEIPIGLGSLPSLNYIYFNGNNFTGTIPEDLGQRTSLKLLYLNGNQLTGNIPQSLTNCVELSRFSLGDNQLTGTIPQGFGAMASMLTFSLANNQLTGTIPSDLGQLTSATKILLSENNLTGSIPASFGQLSALKELHAHTNALTGTIPEGIGNLPDLERIYLYKNQLTGPIPSTFAQLSKLKYLWIYDNQLSGDLPAGMSDLPALTHIWLQNNKFHFENFESQFEQFQGNAKFSLRYSPQAKVNTPTTILSRLGQNLNLSSGVLTSPNNTYEWFKDGVLIEGETSGTLPLGEIDSTDLGVYHFTATNSIVINLTLESHTITLQLAPQDTCGVSESEKQALIDLYNSTNENGWINDLNWLTETPVCDWYGVTVEDGKVVSLDLSNNGLSGELPSSISNLAHLTTLNLEGNNINGQIPTSLGSLLELTSLDLSDNNITGNIPPALGSLSNLTFMDLSGNDLQGVIPVAFCNLAMINILDLSNNQLSGELPKELGLLKQVVRLDLSNNTFQGSLPSQLSGLSNLEFLDVSDNQLFGNIPITVSVGSRLEAFLFDTNKFIFSSFEDRHPDYTANINTDYSYAPQLKTDEKENKMVTIGASITLSTMLSSENNSYQWYKDSVALTGATGRELIIENATLEDAGNYYFLATNSVINDLTLERNEITLTVETSCDISPQQRNALIRLYQDLDGDSWVNQENGDQPWQINDENSPVCNWHGIVVEAGNVVEINLGSNALRGTLPDIFTDLVALRKLDVANNDISKALPQSLTTLTDLTFLAIEGNAFTFIDIETDFAHYQTQLGESFTYIPQDDIEQAITENVPLGSSFTFPAATLTSANNQYQWFKNGLPVATTGDNLVITEATETDAAVYHMEATNTGVEDLVIRRRPVTINIVPGPDSCGVSFEERQALMDLYNSTNEVGWNNDTNWGTDAPVCEWYGITVIDGHVTNISLQVNGLVGTIPASIGQLSQLQFLSLVGNQLEGEIPSSLGELSNLQFLWLYSNRLNGEIPIELGQLIKLKELHLQRNELTGEIPEQLSGAANLSSLDLSENQLAGEVPMLNSIGLSSINLSGNQLSGEVPRLFGPITEIPANNTTHRFVISDNQFIFSDIEPVVNHYNVLGFAFQYAPQAPVDSRDSLAVPVGQSITLSGNTLNSLNNSYQWYKNDTLIAGATDLQYIIDPVVDTTGGTYYFIATNSEVNNLSISRNPIIINALPEGSCAVSGATRQALIAFYQNTDGDNWINTQENIQPWLINDSTSSVCDWYGITVSDNFKLVEINLGDNNLRGELPTSLANLTALKKLDLSGNRLIGELTEELLSLSQLEELRLGRNILVGAIPEDIRNLESLKILQLDSNRISTAIPPEIGQLENVIHLDLSANKLEDDIPDELWNLTALQSLKLQNNQLTGGIANLIGDLSELRTFWVSNNKLTGNIPSEAGALPLLHSIHINDNSFSEELPRFDPTTAVSDSAYLDLQMQNNRFVFSDFEDDYEFYLGEYDNFVYSPQARVDRTENIVVRLGDQATLFTDDLTSPNNTYTWYHNDSLFTVTTSRQVPINNISEEDLGVYYFEATNSVIDTLVLERNRINLVLENITPPDSVETQSFCNAEFDVTIADLAIPNGATTATWYEVAQGGEPLSADTEVSNNSIYWAEIPSQADRIPQFVVLNEGAPGVEDEEYQEFTILEQARVSDLQITGSNITWYNDPVGGSVIPTDSLLATGNYYAQQGANACRFEVEVFVGVFIPDAEGWQSFCASDSATINDIVVEITHEGNEPIWYTSAEGSDTYTGTESLIDGQSYYVSQRDTDGNEGARLRITTFVYDVPAPQVFNSTQTFFVDESPTIADLTAIGSNITWYDQPTGGRAYGLSEALVNGESYYASQTNDCGIDEDGCCLSLERTAVSVVILDEIPPTLIGCEKFRPQPGDRYVISAWVREDGLRVVDSEFRDYNMVRQKFIDLLNYLKDEVVFAEDPQKRNVPAEFVPRPDTREFDVLVPYVKDAVSKNLTIYNFQYIKEQQIANESIARTVGFKFSLDPESTYEFSYLTPRVRENGVTQSFRYPLQHNPSLSLDFVDANICGANFCIYSNFSIGQGTPYSYSSGNIQNRSQGLSGLYSRYEFFSYEPDPDYQVMDYANSLLRLTYRNNDGEVLPVESNAVEFRPKGAIIDGWQRVSADFTVPLEATNMIIALESNIEDNANAELNVYFDDVRIHPFDGNMKSFVYDPVTQRLLAELDENNYATFYEYDHEGGLVRVKKETERGVYTIQETRSGNSKLNR